MIYAITRIWHQRWHRADRRWLAARLGPHLARDIGIDTTATKEVKQL